MNRRIKRITTILDKKKGEDIAVFDLTESGYFVDFVVIATSMAEKHGNALLNELKDELKPKGEEFLHIDDSEGWIVIDMGDILVHIMNSEHRAKFRIEEFLDNLKKEKESGTRPAPQRRARSTTLRKPTIKREKSTKES